MQCIHQSKRELQRCFGPRFNLIFNPPKWSGLTKQAGSNSVDPSDQQNRVNRVDVHKTNGKPMETTRETMVKPGKNSTVPQVAISMSCVYNVYSY